MRISGLKNNMAIQLSDHFGYRRLIRFTLPCIGMMIVSSIYSVVDGFFVSNFAGKTPFAALNLIFPFLMILSTLGFMFGTGGSALVGKTLGEGDNKKANEYFSLFVFVSFILGVILAIIGFIFLRPIAILLGASGDLIPNCMIYGRILLLAVPFNILQFLFQSFVVTAEKPELGFKTTLASGVTNIVLDAILVILLPMEYKLMGAAIATACAQILGGLIPFVYFIRPNNSILRISKTHLDLDALLKATINGSSEFMSNISMNIVGILYNIQLIEYAGENGIAAYGVMMYVSFVFSSTFIGYAIGTGPIISYHYGAKNYDELKNILKKSIIMIGTLSILMVGIGELVAHPLSYIFVGYDPELFELTISGFRIFALSFLFAGFALNGSCFFTALNDGVISAIISFLRTLVFQVAAVILLPMIFDIDGIWYSVIVAELMSVVLCGLFLVIKRNKYHYF